MPGPVSRTVRTTRPAAIDPPTVTDPPSGVCRIAFDTRFERTSRMRTGSTSMIGRSSGVSAVTVTPTASAAGRNDRATSPRSRSGSVGSGWSGRVPASESATVRRSSMRRSSTRVSSRIGARWAASAG